MGISFGFAVKSDYLFCPSMGETDAAQDDERCAVDCGIRAACWWVQAVLLVLHQIRMGGDEIWSVWQSLGTPQQIMDWTPYDWTPGYYLTLGFVAGIRGDAAVRAADAVGVDVSDRLRGIVPCGHGVLGGRRAALVVIPAYGALGYIGVLGTEVRGYALLLGLLPLALWFLIRFYSHPSWRRAIPLIITLAAMPYISLSAFVTFGMVGLFSLIVYGKRWWRAWLPALVTIALVLPIVSDKLTLARTRVVATQTIVLPAPLVAFGNLFRDYLGRGWVVWVVILVVSIGLLLPRLRANRPALALLLWVAGGVVLMYVLNPVLGFFFARYSWWVMIGIALLVALGLAYLPKQAVAGAAVILLGLSFVATPLNEQSSALNDNLEWLHTHIQAGDALVIDPANNCGSPSEWDYAIRSYFPDGLLVASNSDGYRRVWYATFNGRQTAALSQQIANQRVAEEFVGPAGCFIQLKPSRAGCEGHLI